MYPQTGKLACLILAVALAVPATRGVPMPAAEDLSAEEFRHRKYGGESPSTEEEENAVRQLDAIGGGNLLRGLDGNNLLPRQTRQGLDSLSGGSFGNNYVKRFDSLSGGSFGTSKRNLEDGDRSPFEGLHKKNLDEIDRAGFNSFVKKNFDEIERVGFSNFMKRAALARYYQARQGR